MPSMANVILTDRAGTPVNHTFTPQGSEGDSGGRYAKAAASSLGDYVFKINPRQTPGGRRKVDLALSLPVLVTETINGVNSYAVARTSRASASFDFPPDATLQERKDIVGMLYTALATATTQCDSVLTVGENVW
jgi:hypothetical protein